MSDVCRKKYERSEEKVKILERMLEEKTRELYLEHKKIEERNDFLNRILSSMSGCVFVTSSDHKITLANDAAASLLLLPLQKLVGSKFWDLFTPDEHKAAHMGQKEATINRATDGAQIPVSYTYSTLSGEEGGFVYVVKDLSKLRALENQLVQAQKLESIGQLAAGIAHEINTPIQYIRDNTSFVKEEFENLRSLWTEVQGFISATSEIEALDESRKKLTEVITTTDLEYLLEEIPLALTQSYKGAETVARIVRSMKGFSHPGQTEKSPADINEALENTVSISRNEWKYVSDIELKLDPSLPSVLCYLGELNQVFLNLIVNAAHAIEDAKKEGKGKITIVSKTHSDEVEVSISDTGTGIPPDVIDKIFDPFFTTKDVGKGTGQGLALAHSTISEGHNGRIECDTNPGEGTTFKIYIPTNEQDK